MSTLWLVCGTGPAEGETSLARGLSQLLDDGEHTVVVSGEQVLEGRGDVVVFVAGRVEDRPLRNDELLERAHIVVDTEAPIGPWRAVLARTLGQPKLEEQILELLLAHARRMPTPALSARTKVWLQLSGDHGMGKGLAQLLAGVDEHGTLSAAAKASRMSYRHAWDLIRTAESRLGAPLLVSRPGGAGGGGSSLSVLGLHLVRCFQQLDRELASFAALRLDELLSGDGGP